MSAAELIEQIKALPPADLEEVRSFLLNGRVEDKDGAKVSYLGRQEARVLGDKIMERHDELFRKLAQ